MEGGEYTGRCIHCGLATIWVTDPAPDLCVRCAVAGLWSPQWGPDDLAEYQAMLSRLLEKRKSA